MGQHWRLVNLDKKEYVDQSRFGSVLELRLHLEQSPGTGAALVVLLAAQVAPRGGGDLDMTTNWHGPERAFPDNIMSPGPMPPGYPELAKSVIGRWVGDRVLLIGDYADDGDKAHFKVKNIEGDDPWGHIYKLCRTEGGTYKDVSGLVASVIEHELGGKFKESKFMKGVYSWEGRKEVQS